MATWFIDYVNGIDANPGTSWGAAFKTINGATGAKGVVAGDTVCIAKSPDPTSLGQTATWTTANLPVAAAPKSLNAATNASPIACTTTASHGFSTGDFVNIVSTVGNTAANGQWLITVTGATTFTLNNSTGNGAYTSGGTVSWWTNRAVALTTAVTANIDNCDTAWTAANSATVTRNAVTFKEGTGSVSIAPPSSAANTLYAFHALGSTIDFSAYQQISFWVRNTGVVIADNARYRICLCSDNAGITIVNSAAIPAIPSLSSWVPVTVDFGVALGSSIQSVALYSGASTMATVTLLIDSIIACKASSAADSLTLQSLIGKNTGSEGWFAIQSINGTVVMLDNAPSTVATGGQGYSGATGAVTTFKRETIKTALVSSGGTPAQSPNLSGTVANPVTFTGGYNTGSGVQDGQTYYDGLSGQGIGLNVGQTSVYFDHLNFCRYNTGIIPSSTNISLSGNDCSNCTTNGIVLSGLSLYGYQINYANINNNANAGISITFSSNIQLSITNCNSNQNGNVALSNNSNISGFITNVNNCSGGSGMSLGGTAVLRGATINNNATSGVAFSGAKNMLKDYIFTNGTSGISDVTMPTSAPDNALYNCIFSAPAFGNTETNRVGAQRYNQTASNKVFSGSWTAITDSVVIHTSPTAWMINLANATKFSQLASARLPIARLAVNASTLVTVTAWLRRDSTNVSMGIACPGNQINGVNSDVIATITPAINTYAQAILTFTPTEDGVVDIEFWVWNSTSSNTNAWVTDLSFSQG